MPRLQDILFAALAIVLIAMLAYHLRIAVFALVGAFACGALYIFVGMIPSRTETFCGRLFTTVFLATVMSCLVLILPGTFGAMRPDSQNVIIAIAALPPIAAICFEVARTPAVLRTILRVLGYR